MPTNRYNDYYLVYDEDDLEFIANHAMEMDDSDKYKPNQSKWKVCKCFCWFFISLIILAIIAFVLIFVVFPLVFMNSLSLQQLLVFTHSDLISDKHYYEHYRFAGLKNHYIQIKDVDEDEPTLYLGLWHILPFELAEESLNNPDFNYDEALKSSNYSVLLYFHGTGEDRSQSERKYQLFRQFFHVITFDYRSYADSTAGNLLENSVINDCIQIYRWLENRTDSQIYVWGHSLGAALALHTLAEYKNNNLTGLILEAPFTTLKDEIYVHTYSKYFTWVPWFELTIINPLERNGFIFNSVKHIKAIETPIMFLHAKDDSVIPYTMSEELYNVATHRNVSESVINGTVLHIFNGDLRLDHEFVYQDSYVVFYLYDFIKTCSMEKNDDL